MDLKYLVVGSGAMGGFATGFLKKIGKDVTMIARGVNYDVIKKDGLHIKTPNEEYTVYPKISTWEEYDETPDIVMVTVKAYNLEEIAPNLDKVCNKDTIIFTVANSFDAGAILEEHMKTKCSIVSGVVYVPVVRLEPGHIKQKLDFYNMVLGMRKGDPVRDELYQIKKDFEETGAKVYIKPNPVKNALRKFFRVSGLSAVSCYYNATIGEVRSTKEGVQLFKELTQELVDIAEAMGDPFTMDDADPFPGMLPCEESLDCFMTIFPEYQTSMKYDWDNNHQTEIREQILDVIDLGEKYGVPMTAYRKVAKRLIELKPDQVTDEERKIYG